MNGYKLVPVEPTPEMEQAAEKYWNERKFKALSGDPRTWKGLYTAMLAAAPAVQGEPVAAVVEEVFGSDGTSDFINARLPVGTKLYTAPQPAEQQPELCRTQPCGCVICFCENETQCMGCGAKHCGTHPVGQLPNPVYQQPAEQHPEAVREGAPYDDPAFSALCREHEVYGTAAAAQCAVFWEAGKRAGQQPDVAQLVEALQNEATSLCDAVESINELPPVMYALQAGAAVNKVRDAVAALADYRKQGGEA